MHSQQSNNPARSKTRPLSRRTMLGSLAGLSVSVVAGCSGGSNGSNTHPSPTTTTSGQGAIKQVRVDGLELVIDLTESAEIGQVNIIAPSGELFAKQSIEAGVRTVIFDLGTSYDPGEFRVLALRDGEKVAEVTHTIQPELRITEFGLGANHPEEMPEDMGKNAVEGEAFLTIENRGSGPDAIQKLLILGDVPNPTTELGADSNTDTGIWLPEMGTVKKGVIVESGGTRRIYTSTIPFAFIRGEGVTCRPESQSGTFEVILDTSVVDRVSNRYAIEYSAAEEFDLCTMTVQEAS